MVSVGPMMMPEDDSLGITFSRAAEKALRAENARLRDELTLHRTGHCCFCGARVFDMGPYGENPTLDYYEEIRKAICNHDAECEKNPLTAEIADLRQLLPTAEECLRLIQSIEECAWGVPVTLLPKLKATMAMLEEGQE